MPDFGTLYSHGAHFRAYHKSVYLDTPVTGEPAMGKLSKDGLLFTYNRLPLKSRVEALVPDEGAPCVVRISEVDADGSLLKHRFLLPDIDQEEKVYSILDSDGMHYAASRLACAEHLDGESGERCGRVLLRSYPSVKVAKHFQGSLPSSYGGVATLYFGHGKDTRRTRPAGAEDADSVAPVEPAVAKRRGSSARQKVADRPAAAAQPDDNPPSPRGLTQSKTYDALPPVNAASFDRNAVEVMEAEKAARREARAAKKAAAENAMKRSMDHEQRLLQDMEVRPPPMPSRGAINNDSEGPIGSRPIATPRTPPSASDTPSRGMGTPPRGPRVRSSTMSSSNGSVGDLPRRRGPTDMTAVRKAEEKVNTLRTLLAQPSPNYPAVKETIFHLAQMASPSQNSAGPESAAQARVGMVSAHMVENFAAAIRICSNNVDVARYAVVALHDVLYFRGEGADVASDACAKLLCSPGPTGVIPISSVLNALSEFMSDPDFVSRTSTLIRALCTSADRQKILLQLGAEKLLQSCLDMHRSRSHCMQYAAVALGALFGEPVPLAIVSTGHESTFSASPPTSSSQYSQQAGSSNLALPVSNSRKSAPFDKDQLSPAMFSDTNGPNCGSSTEKYFEHSSCSHRASSARAEQEWLQLSSSRQLVEWIRGKPSLRELVERLASYSNLTDENSFTVATLMKAIGQRMKTPETRAEVVNLVLVDPVLRFMRRQPPVFEVHHNGLNLLHGMMHYPEEPCSEEAANQICLRGGIHALVFALKSFVHDPEVAARAMHVLRLTCQYGQSGISIATIGHLGGVYHCLEAMKTHPTDTALIDVACRTLVPMANNATNRRQMLSLEGVECFCATIYEFKGKNHPPEDFVSCVVLLGNLGVVEGSEQETRVLLDTERYMIIDALLMLLEDMKNHSRLMLDILRALGNMLCTSGAQGHMAFKGNAALLPIVTMLLPNSPHARSEALMMQVCIIITWLAHFPPNKQILGSLQTNSALLGCGLRFINDVDFCRQVLVATGRLLRDSLPNAQESITGGLIPYVQQVLSVHNDPQVVSLAVAVIYYALEIISLASEAKGKKEKTAPPVSKADFKSLVPTIQTVKKSLQRGSQTDDYCEKILRMLRK